MIDRRLPRMGTAKSTLKPVPSVDDFAKAAGGVDLRAAGLRQADTSGPVTRQPFDKTQGRPQHPGLTRRDLDLRAARLRQAGSIVSGGSLNEFAFFHSWRGPALVIGLVLLSWCVIAGIIWTLRELYGVLRLWF